MAVGHGENAAEKPRSKDEEESTYSYEESEDEPKSQKQSGQPRHAPLVPQTADAAAQRIGGLKAQLQTLQARKNELEEKTLRAQVKKMTKEVQMQEELARSSGEKNSDKKQDRRHGKKNSDTKRGRSREAGKSRKKHRKKKDKTEKSHSKETVQGRRRVDKEIHLKDLVKESRSEETKVDKEIHSRAKRRVDKEIYAKAPWKTDKQVQSVGAKGETDSSCKFCKKGVCGKHGQVPCRFCLWGPGWCWTHADGASGSPKKLKTSERIQQEFDEQERRSQTPQRRRPIKLCAATER
jgi:hypothetical protein